GAGLRLAEWPISSIQTRCRPSCVRDRMLQSHVVWQRSPRMTSSHRRSLSANCCLGLCARIAPTSFSESRRLPTRSPCCPSTKLQPIHTLSYAPRLNVPAHLSLSQTCGSPQSLSLPTWSLYLETSGI